MVMVNGCMNKNIFCNNSINTFGNIVILSDVKESEKKILVSGKNFNSEIYCILIKAFQLLNNNAYKIFLRVPYITKKDINKFILECNMDNYILFYEISEKEEYNNEFEEEIIINECFGDNFFIKSESRIIPGVLKKILEYLKDRFGS